SIIVSVEQQTGQTTSTITGTTQPTQTRSTRLVVMGDVDFAADQLVQATNNYNNVTLFANTVNWLAQSEERISVPPRSEDQRTLTLDAAAQSLIFYTSVLFLPL